jgi:hypothetical protein
MPLPLAEPFRLDFWRAGWLHRAGGRGKTRRLRVQETRQQRIEHFKTAIYGRVEGWLGDRMWQIVDVIGTTFEANGIRGNIVEFGVHHGLFLFLLNVLRNNDEQCFAIDIFDDQHLNVDASGGDGRGSLAMFLSHIETLMARQRHFFQIVRRDTMSFSASEVVGLFGERGVKSSRSTPATRFNTPATTFRWLKKCPCPEASSLSTTTCRYTGRA